MSHPVRYSNDKSTLIEELEAKQGTTYFPSEIYVHSDKRGFKRLYLLDYTQRIFMFFEDPKASLLGNYFGAAMLAVIVLNLVIFIISTLAEFNYQPDTCESPACNDDAVLCDGKVVCAPVPKEWTGTVELVCVILFTVEYLARLLLVWKMPPRLADVLKKKKKRALTMASIFTTNRPSSKDELFAYAKSVLEDCVTESTTLVRAKTPGKQSDDKGKIAQELMNVSPSSSVVTSDKYTIPGDSQQNSGKFPENVGVGQYRSSTPVAGLEVVSENSEANQLRVVTLAEREVYEAAKRAESSETYDEDEGFQLADMNRAIFTTGEENLVDADNTLENYGKYSKVATVPPAGPKARGEDWEHAPVQPPVDSASTRKRKLQQRRATRIAAHTVNEHDTLEDISKKSLEMDRSHRYSGTYKTYKYGIKILNVIDLVAILPFYIEMLMGGGNSSLSVVRVLRLARVFRIFKMGKGSSGVQMLGKTILISLPALSLLFFFISLGVILFGAIIYFLEGGDFKVTAEYDEGAWFTNNFFGTGDVVTGFRSIAAGCYWAVVTTTTTGYGDLVPYTTLGRLVSILCAYYGVLLLALPITVIGNNFDKILNAQQGRDNEQFIYECLAGITKSLDVEYRARTKLAPVPSSAYKMTLITAIISTFDTTKQTLLKDAISSANREAIALRNKCSEDGVSENGVEPQEHQPSGTHLDRTSEEASHGMSRGRTKTAYLRRAVDLLEEGLEKEPAAVMSEESRGASMDMYSFEAAKRRQAEKDGEAVSDEIVISATDVSKGLYTSQNMKLGNFTGGDANSGGPPGKRYPPRDGDRKGDGDGVSNSPQRATKTNEVDSSGMGSIPSSQKMAGITWNNMPTMPRKRKSESERMKFRKFDASGQPLSALQELADAQKELQTAIAEWTKQLGAFPDLTEGNDDGVNWE